MSGREIRGKIEGDIEVVQDGQLFGMVTGSVTVMAPSYYVVYGMVCGDLIAQPGSTVVVQGTVVGAVINNGANIEIAGMVGSIQENDGVLRARIIDGAVIRN